MKTVFCKLRASLNSNWEIWCWYKIHWFALPLNSMKSRIQARRFYQQLAKGGGFSFRLRSIFTRIADSGDLKIKTNYMKSLLKKSDCQMRFVGGWCNSIILFFKPLLAAAIRSHWCQRYLVSRRGSNGSHISSNNRVIARKIFGLHNFA